MSQQSIQATVEQLAQSSGGQILASLRTTIEASLKYYVGLFLLGFMVAFPMTSAFISWLVDDARLPDGVEIIVISPVEFLFLQLRIAGSVGLVLVVLLVVVQVTKYGLRHEAVKSRLTELDVQLPKPGPRVLLAILVSSLLLVLGACLLYTSPSPRDLSTSRMPSSA